MAQLIEKIYLSEMADHEIREIKFTDTHTSGLVIISTDENDDDSAYLAVEFDVYFDIDVRSGEEVGGYMFVEPSAEVEFVYPPKIKIVSSAGVEADEITDEVEAQICEIICDFIYSQEIDAPNHYDKYPAFW